MNKILNLVNKSIFSSVGTLLHEDDIDKFLQYVIFNINILKKFPYIIYSFNGVKNLVSIAEIEIKKLLPNNHIHFIFSENLGHTFGIFLSENLIFEHAKNLNFDYIWKFSNDVIIQPEIFDVDITQSDFYYINNIGYNAFLNETPQSLFEKIKNKTYFYPQTNYYIIKNKIIFYPVLENIYELHTQYAMRPNKDMKPWEYIPYCDCENFLKKTIEENKLSIQMLLNDNELEKIINIVKLYKIWDGSHKNIAYKRFGNLCHLQWPEQNVIEI